MLALRLRRFRTKGVLGDLAGEPETAADGRRAGEILGRLRKGSRVVSLVDAMLAAVAERTPAVVLTDDLQDFARMREEAGAAATFLSV